MVQEAHRLPGRRALSAAQRQGLDFGMMTRRPRVSQALQAADQRLEAAQPQEPFAKRNLVTASVKCASARLSSHKVDAVLRLMPLSALPSTSASVQYITVRFLS